MAAGLERSAFSLGCRTAVRKQLFQLMPNAISRNLNQRFTSQDIVSTVKEEKCFEELLESSPLMKMRRPQGRTVTGKITNVCNDDLYVDFGGKFYTVVKKPAINPEYVSFSFIFEI